MNKIQNKYEEMYRNLFEIIPDSVFIADPNYKKLIDCNKRAEKLTGHSRKEIFSMSVDQLFPKDLVKRTMEDFEKHAAGELLVVLTEVLTKNKKRIPVSINATTIEFHGKPCLLGVFRDITSIKKTEEELKQRIKEIDGLYHLSLLAEEVKSFEELVVRFAKEIVPPSMQFPDKVHTGFNLDGKNYIACHEHEPSEIAYNISAPILVKGKQRGKLIIGYLEDLSFLKEFEQKLVNEYANRFGMIIGKKEVEEKYRKLIESLDEVIYKSDPKTFQASFVNIAIKEFYGYTVEEWLKNPALWKNSIHPNDKERVFAGLARAQIKKEPYAHEYRIVRKDKTIRWVRDNISWEKDKQGNLVSINGVMHDITERKKAEEQVKKSNKALQSKVNELERFFKLTVGRELKMVDLKKKIKELENSQNKKQTASTL